MYQRQPQRRNVYRDAQRADGAVALACLFAAIILAALVATSERPSDVYDTRSDDIMQTYTPQH